MMIDKTKTEPIPPTWLARRFAGQFGRGRVMTTEFTELRPAAPKKPAFFVLFVISFFRKFRT